MTNFGRAFAKSQIGAGTRLPMGGTVFLSVKDADKDLVEAPARELVAMGFSLIATRGTAKALAARGPARRHHQQGAGGPPPCGGRAQEWRNPSGVQHHRRRPGAGGFLVHPAGGADPESALLHDHGGGQRPATEAIAALKGPLLLKSPPSQSYSLAAE